MKGNFSENLNLFKLHEVLSNRVGLYIGILKLGHNIYCSSSNYTISCLNYDFFYTF